MSFIETTILSLKPFFIAYAPLISFFAAGLGGEATVILLSFLAAGGYFPLYIVFIFGMLGTLFSDSAWFLLTRLKIINKFKEWQRVAKHYKKIEQKAEAFTHKSDFWILFIAKFLYGTRLLTVIYISLRKISYLRFLAYDAVSTAVWFLVMMSIGYASGKGFMIVLDVFKNLQLAVSLLIFISVLFYVFGKWINKKFSQ